MPGGESLADVQTRGLAFLRKVQARELRRPIVIITHHIVVETMVAHALKRDLSQLWLSIPTGNCFLSELELTDDGIRALTVYDGAHLGEAAQPYFEGERVA